MGVLSVVASYTGVKFIADLGAKGWQYIVSNPAERKRIQEIFLAKERELGETTEPTAIEQKKAKLEEAINASKFLTKEKKAELLARLNKTVDEYESKDKALHEERDGKILNLLKEAIQTRVKNTQLLKEGLNSALMVAGLSAMRGVAYGAVAGYERYKKVAQERAEGKREGGQFKEWIWKGFTETLNNLRGGKADTWAGKGMNFVKGATNVLRAAGFADLAIAEWVGEGRSVSSVIEKSLKAFEEKGYATAAWENIKAPWQRLGHLGEYAKSAVTGSEPPPAPWSTPDGATGAGAPGSPEAAAAAGAAGAAGVAAAEATPQVEIPEAQIEAGLVKKGDGILKILERQGVEGKSALEAAREAGIVRTAGDTRLTTEAIGRLSVFAEAKPEGGIEIKFLDTETDKVLTLAQAREAGFTYESGTAPGAIATEAEIVEHVPLASEAETLIDSPDVPNDLLGGTLHLYTDAQGHFTSLDPGDGDMFLRLNEALQELDKQGHGDSPEAKFIFEQYKQLLAMEDVAMIEEVPTAAAVEETTRRVVEERTAAVAAPEMVVEGEPLKIFRGESGRIKFVYDKDGVVKDAFLPAYTPRPRDIEDSLQEWGLTNKEVKAHFFEGAARTHMDGTLIDTSHPGRYPEPNPTLDRSSFPIQSPGNDYRQFVRDAEKLSRQESLLSEMEEKGLARTPEYARVKMETTRLESFVAEKMKKEFHIKERPI
ncbi:hypothetical protein HY630_03470 [Candidatus Uhrbacteria bacterium]|nr:hypothetical protein [Candidatus Uhrbacteria bacterium]